MVSTFFPWVPRNSANPGEMSRKFANFMGDVFFFWCPGNNNL